MTPPDRAGYRNVAINGFILITLFVLALPAFSGGNNGSYHILTIIGIDGNKQTISATELLDRRETGTITIRDMPAYPGKELALRVIKFADLMNDFTVPDDSSIEFMATDGFTSPIDSEKVMNTDKSESIAYVAIEEPGNMWPEHSSGQGTAGPYYLIWINPGLSDIGREEWPYKFNKISINEPVGERYAAIVPDPAFNNEHPVFRGYEVFTRNCIACHKLDRVGPGTMGPDLNYPMSPVEYFRNGILRQFIRDPQSIRLKPGSAMKGFSREELSEQELDYLIAYFRYMSKRED